jgi:AcrR family transcriptional regulator
VRGLREQKKLDAQRALRAAALRLFTEHGYAAVSIEQIAAAAGVGRTTFFNYFPSKEAVVLEPDPLLLVTWRRLRAERPAAEPLWRSLTEVLLGSMEQGRDWLIAQKLLRAASPDAGPSVTGTNARLTLELRAWVEERTAAQQLPGARLQLNIAVSAVLTAFDDWEPEQSFGALISTAARYLEVLGRAFSADPAAT